MNGDGKMIWVTICAGATFRWDEDDGLRFMRIDFQTPLSAPIRKPVDGYGQEVVDLVDGFCSGKECCIVRILEEFNTCR